MTTMRKLIALAIAAFAIVACFPQGQCEANPPVVDYCGPTDATCQGHVIDATHWESGPVMGKWLPYEPSEVITMHMRDATTGQVLSGQITSFNGYVGATQVQDPNGTLPAQCAGTLCEELQLDPSSFKVENFTCATQYFYAVVTIVPTADAGTD